MFRDSYNADGEDDFLSANGKSRKQKRAAKKAEKEEKLRQRKGAEISASVQNQVGDVLGLPVMPIPQKEEKKGIKKVFSNIKDKHEQRQADKLFKKDYKRSKEAGTLSKAEFSEPKKKSINVMDTVTQGLGSVKKLILDEDEEEPVAKKKAGSGDVAKWVILGLGAAALVVIALNRKGLKTQSK